jgi:hypothetical protein
MHTVQLPGLCALNVSLLGDFSRYLALFSRDLSDFCARWFDLQGIDYERGRGRPHYSRPGGRRYKTTLISLLFFFGKSRAFSEIV